VLYYAFRDSKVFCIKVQDKTYHDIEMKYFNKFQECSTIIHHIDEIEVKEELWGIIMPGK
jgi:hypothetical protein